MEYYLTIEMILKINFKNYNKESRKECNLLLYNFKLIIIIKLIQKLKKFKFNLLDIFIIYHFEILIKLLLIILISASDMKLDSCCFLNI